MTKFLTMIVFVLGAITSTASLAETEVNEGERIEVIDVFSNEYSIQVEVLRDMGCSDAEIAEMLPPMPCAVWMVRSESIAGEGMDCLWCMTESWPFEFYQFDCWDENGGNMWGI